MIIPASLRESCAGIEERQAWLNALPRIVHDLQPLIGRFAERLAVDAERVRSWLFARAAAGPNSQNEESLSIARALAGTRS